MATTTPNFGWPVPTSTDLVKDGATAIEALGDGIDTSLVDLKGGTTGQVLAKATNADMDFTWVVQDDSNAIQNTIVDAKGDLIAASASDVPARLAVGANGETLVADSSTSTGLRYQGSMAAGKNFVINGNFDIWQRGTSFAAATVSAYTADRWQITSGTQTATISQQTTGAPNGSRYVLRNAYTSAGSYGNFYQGIETNNALQLSGKTVTLSIKIRKNATLTTDLNLVIAKSATVDAAYSATWTTVGQTTITNASMPTGTTSADWYTASVTATIPNDGTANSLRIGISEVSTQPSGAYWEISQAQLELGSVATAFSRAGGTIQGETSACQRYYYRITPSSTNSGYAIGNTYSSTITTPYVYLPVQMRIAPTIDTSGTAGHYAIQQGAGSQTCNSVPSINQSGFQVIQLQANVASGLTAGYVAQLYSLSTSGYLGFIAEL